MRRKLRFHKYYFAWTIFLFVIEFLIAIYVHDKIIRPYIGDVLVVIFVYCFIKSFLEIPVLPAAIFTLALSFFIETMQYFQIVNLLGLEHSRLARILIGTSFAWIDFICYTAGIIFVLMVEKIILSKIISK